MTSTKFLDNLTLDRFRLDSENRTGVIVNHGLDAITLDSFTLDARRQLSVENEISIKYDQHAYVFPECKIKYTQSGQVFSDSKIKYDQHAYIHPELKVKYDQLHFVRTLEKVKYDQQAYVYPESKIKYDQYAYVYPELKIKYDQQAYVHPELKVKYDQLHFVSTLEKIKYDQRSYVYPKSKIKYDQQAYVYPESKIKYDQYAYIYPELKIKYRQLHSINNLIKIKYDQQAYVYPESKIKYDQYAYVYPELKIKYDQHAYISSELKIKYVQGPPLLTTLVNYLEITTLQGSKMYPIIEDASIEKGVDIDTAKITIFENIPPYSLCRLYVNYNIILFEGIATSCPKKGNVYELEVVDYLEHLQPNSPKPGLYLRKYEWKNVQLQYFLSSNKPTLNNNTLGILYMANSVVPHVLFEVYDINNHIYVWTITGSTHTITEVFEDITVLTARTSLAQLATLSGWYYDSVANKFYVRHTDDVSPYDHVLTIPNIWDGPMPIRLGVLSTTKGTTVVAYAQTADFDIPLETINTYLYSLGLEYESSVRNGITYIDISETRGSGSIISPANTYVTSLNILKINEIDSNNAKYSTNGVFLQGYGSGAGSVTAGVYRNMGIGGRFVFLEDASMHGETQATDYVENYLEEMYLPAQSITFEAPLDILGIYDNRNVGDFVKVVIPVEDFSEDLRVQKLQIFLKDSIIKITAGDRLFSLEQKLKAIKSANEKYRKHLEDTIEEISLNWDANIDSGITRDFDFEIKDNTLSIQKLEISYDISKMIIDTGESSPTSSPAGGGEGGGGEAGAEDGTQHGHVIKSGENTDASSSTVEVSAKTHSHPLSLTNMGAPTAVVYFPSVNHKHPVGTLVNGTPNATTSVVNSISYGTYSAAGTAHTHNQGSLSNGYPDTGVSVIYQLLTSTYVAATTGHTHPSGTLANGSADNPVNVIYELLYGNCTAPNCVRTFACGSNVRSVSAYNHNHGILGNTGVPSGSPTTITYVYGGNATDVAARWHLHAISGSTGTPSSSTATITYATSNETIMVGSATHLHTITGDTGVPDTTSDTAAGPGHRHTGRTDDNITGETVSHKDHVHNIGGKVVEEVTDMVITMPESNSWVVDSDLGDPDNPNDTESMCIVNSGSNNPVLDPDMYLNLSIVSGATVTPILGSPFTVSTEDVSKNSGGPILIDSIVNTDGKYKIRATISNKTEPGHACRCKLAVRLNGRIFVDTIYSG